MREICEDLAYEIAKEELEKLEDKLKEQIDGQEALIKSQTKLTKELSNLASNGNGLMDAITKYVMTEGFRDRMKEIREEFCTKLELQTSSNNFCTTKELDKTKKDIVN